MSATASSVLPRLEKLLGSEQVGSDAMALRHYVVDGKEPAAVAHPRDSEEVAAVVRFAAAGKLGLIPAGGRSKLRIGAPPSRYDLALDLTGLNSVLAYDPGDLTLGVQPGIRLADLNRVLAEQNQFLPLATAFGNVATVGGLVASNAISPFRYAYGAARDFVLGMEVVTGEGTVIKSGGSVVKNVTGYDLHKLLIGSYGALGVITRINFKTFPWPPARQTLVASFEGIEGALAFCRAIRQSPLEPRMVELLDPSAARLVELQGSHLPAGHWSAIVATAGKPGVVARHAKDLAAFAEEQRALTFSVLAEEEMAKLLAGVREFVSYALQASSGTAILRVNVLPSAIGGVVSRFNEVASRHAIPSATLVRAMGIIYYVLLPEQSAALIPSLTQAVTELMQSVASADSGAQGMVEWCPAELKSTIDIWGAPRGDLDLMRRVKDVFDPLGIMSPGRSPGGM